MVGKHNSEQWKNVLLAYLWVGVPLGASEVSKAYDVEYMLAENPRRSGKPKTHPTVNRWRSAFINSGFLERVTVERHRKNGRIETMTAYKPTPKIVIDFVNEFLSAHKDYLPPEHWELSDTDEGRIKAGFEDCLRRLHWCFECNRSFPHFIRISKVRVDPVMLLVKMLMKFFRENRYAFRDALSELDSLYWKLDFIVNAMPNEDTLIENMDKLLFGKSPFILDCKNSEKWTSTPRAVDQKQLKVLMNWLCG